MPRPPKSRTVQGEPRATYFKPRGVPARGLETVVLGLDELEAIRLADLEGLYQEDAATHMNISRPTFGRLVAQARHKVADALFNGKALVFAGGAVNACQALQFECMKCDAQWEAPPSTPRSEQCPWCRSDQVRERAEESAPSGRGRGRRRGRGGPPGS